MSKPKALLTLLLCMVAQMIMAQSKVISGTVEDSMGPIMMANVTERDGNNRIVNATQTDMMGNFSMEIKNPKNKLVVSYVGSKTKSVVIGNNTTFTIKLEDEKTTLNEVTVKGRRTNAGGLNIPKKEISTSQQTFNLEEVSGMAFTSADEALQGEIAGLDIVSNSGNLGAGTSMRLRGVTTINGNAEPLIVVDDKIFDNPNEDFDFANADEEQYSSLLSVAVEDIASITVLKDAAATAVWGSQGANGVIQITTKRGSRGKTRVNFSYKFTGTWSPKGYDLLNGDDYSMMLKEMYYNPSQSAYSTSYIREINYDKSWSGEYENWNNNTDWVKAVQQFGTMQSYALNLTGGGQKATFRISGNYDHQTGTIIKQTLDRFSTRLVLDYNVSDRIKFSTNFGLVYTDNLKNYSDLLAIAQKMSPNMSIYRQDNDGNDLDDYYIMNPTGTSAHLNLTGVTDRTAGTPYYGSGSEYSSYEMSSIKSLGNPIAIANNAWAKDQTYRITPDFTIKYELLGTGAQQSRLTFNGRVDFDIFAESTPKYYPGSLVTGNGSWTGSSYNNSYDSEYNRLKIGGRVDLTFTPYFRNEDFTSTMFIRYEMSTQKSTTQTITRYQLPNGIESPTVEGALGGMSSSNSKAASQRILYNSHFSYKGIYSLGFSLSMDGNSKFGPKNKWAYFPGVSLRYNISDEKFFKPLTKVVSMMGLRASWGINGKAPDSDYLFYNTYATSGQGTYGQSGDYRINVATLSGMKLDDLKWETTTSYNLGFNLGFLNDIIEIDFDYYHKDTKDLLQSGVTIPSTTGFSKVAYANVGRMTNNGWELNLNAKKFLKLGKFSMSASFNIAQNENEIKEMDQRVLDAVNSEWTTSRGSYQNLIQVGNSLGSIYGFRYKGVYQYSYQYLQNYNKEQQLIASQKGTSWTSTDYENWINEQIAAGHTFPVAIGSDGKVLMNTNGEPKALVFNYTGDGASTYTFQGGDAIYEDVNHDGQINALDVVYLGNSLPKASGGFSFTFNYGRWSLKTRFMYRWGNEIVNNARMSLEEMFNAYNQCSTVNYRWRKDGDGADGSAVLPRAMYNTGYNWQGCSRYVEDGSFVRLQNVQISYDFDKKLIKKIGFNNLRVYVSMNNLFCLTKYSGVDPEISTTGWGGAYDNSRTPRSKSFTASIDLGF